MARPTKVRGMDVTPFSGVKIQKVGAIYTRTLEEGGAIYFEKGVDWYRLFEPLSCQVLLWPKGGGQDDRKNMRPPDWVGLTQRQYRTMGML